MLSSRLTHEGKRIGSGEIYYPIMPVLTFTKYPSNMITILLNQLYNISLIPLIPIKLNTLIPTKYPYNPYSLIPYIFLPNARRKKDR